MTAPTAPTPGTEAPPKTLAEAFARALPELQKLDAESKAAAGVVPPAPAAVPENALDVLLGGPAPEAPAPETPAAAAGEPPAPEPPAPEPETFVVTIPAHRPEQEPLDVAFTDQGTADMVQHLAKTYVRAVALDAREREIEQQRDEAETLLDEFKVDPLGLLESATGPMDRADIALHLLADPAVWQEAQERLEALADPAKGGEVRVSLREQRIQSRDQTRQKLERSKTIRSVERQTYQIIDALTPPDLDEAAATDYRALAEGDLRRAIQQRGGQVIPPKEVPRILRARLNRMGLTDEQIADRLEAVAGGHRPLRRSSTPVSGAPVPKPPAAAHPTIDQLKAAAQARPVTGAPPGVGVPAVQGHRLPPGSNINDAIRILREKVGRTPN